MSFILARNSQPIPHLYSTMCSGVTIHQRVWPCELQTLQILTHAKTWIVFFAEAAPSSTTINHVTMKNFSHALLCRVIGMPSNIINTFFKVEAIIYTGVNQKRCSGPSGFTPMIHVLVCKRETRIHCQRVCSLGRENSWKQKRRDGTAHWVHTSGG